MSPSSSEVQVDGSAVVRFARNVARRLASNDLGQDLVELTMVTPIMLLVVFGIIEFGSILDSQQAMSHLTREGANIASRGAPLDTVLAVTLRNGADIELDARGGAVVSRVLVEGGVPNVDYQVASAGYAGASQLGNPGDPVMAGSQSGGGGERLRGRGLLRPPDDDACPEFLLRIAAEHHVRSRCLLNRLSAGRRSTGTCS